MSASPKRWSPEAVEVYRRAVAGACASTIARERGVSKQIVGRTLAKLLNYGAIVKVNQGSTPILYRKGEKSKILDELAAQIKHSESKPANVGSAAGTPPHAVAHSIGAVYNVERMGDIGELRVRGATVPFLRRRGDMRGVENWVGRITLEDGRAFTVRLLDGKESHQLYIYLHEYAMTADDLAKRPQELVDLNQQAQDCANHLQKWGGWRLGLPEVMRGAEPHFVVESEAARELARIVGPGAKSRDGSFEVDGSHPKGLEVKGADSMAAVRKALDVTLDDINDLPHMKQAVGMMAQAIQMMQEELTLLRQHVGIGLGPRPPAPGDGREVA